MKNKKNDTILFHIVLDPDLLRNLLKYARKQKISFSKLINDILNKYEYLLNKIECNDGTGLYENCNETLLKINCHKKVRIEKRLKNLLFCFQNHFKLRSKGSVLRFLLRKYLNDLKEFGEIEMENKLKSESNAWDKIKYRIWKMKIFEEGHMSHLKNSFRLELINKSYQIMQINYPPLHP